MSEEAVDGNSDGLRQRHAGDGSGAPPPKPTKPAATKEKKRGPGEGTFVSDFVKKHMDSVIKVVYGIERGVNMAVKGYNKASEMYNDVVYTKLAAYNPRALVGMFTGVILAFFGGFFIVSVAMYEAFHQAGAHILYENLEILSKQIHSVKAASEADDRVDDDGDGIPDVQQITKEELAQRKLVVALKAMEPFVVQNALGSLWTATLGAASTVKLQFARTVALGVTIGDAINRPVQRYVVPVVETVCPEYVKKWLPSVFGYICRASGASIAFSIQRILSTVSTAMRGGHLMIDSFADFCETRGLTYLSEGYVDDIAAWIIVALGIYFQLFLVTSLPLIIKLLVLPLWLVEWFLTTLVATV